MDVEHAGPRQPKVGRGRGLPRSGGPAFVDDRAPPIKADELVDLSLPTQWGGRPAREASPPGGEDQVAKCGKLTTWLISPPHAVGRSAGSRSEPAGWGRSGCLVDLASPRSGEVGRLAKRARRVGTIKLPSAER